MLMMQHILRATVLDGVRAVGSSARAGFTCTSWCLSQCTYPQQVQQNAELQQAAAPSVHQSGRHQQQQQQHNQMPQQLSQPHIQELRAQQRCSDRQQQQLQHQLQHPLHSIAGTRAFSSSSSQGAVGSGQPGEPHAGAAAEQPGTPRSLASLEELEQTRQLDELLQVLLHPMPRAASWNAQLSPYLLQVNDQLLLQPSAVLLSVVRALHVLRGVLAENGQVYVVENNNLLRPLVKTAALSCINPNVWFDHRTWSPGTLTNYASSKRLFRESHQPNRKLFAAKGLRPVNPLCTAPRQASAPLPRLSWQDKWLLYRRTRRPGYRQLLQKLLAAEDAMYRFKPAGSLKGVPQDLQLMIFLDSTKNAVAIKEAYNRNIPTIAITNTTKDMSLVTYPVLARDSSPAFVHFFLDWIVKVANVAPSEREAASSGSTGNAAATH